VRETGDAHAVEGNLAVVGAALHVLHGRAS
jgi:hypothetical protein